MSIKETLEELQKLITTVKVVVTSKTLAAAGDYAAEEVMSEDAVTGTPFLFAGMSKVRGGSGVIEKAIALCSTTALTPRLTLYLFNRLPTCSFTDNAANTAVVAGDRFSYQGKIDFPAMEDLGTGMSEAVATPNTTGNLPLLYVCEESFSLWGVLVTRASITGEAAGMSMTLSLTVRQF